VNRYCLLDRLAVVGALLAFVTTLNYTWSSSRFGNEASWLFKTTPRGVAYFTNERLRPVFWALDVLVAGIVLASYGSRLDIPYGRTVLSVAGVVLMVMGKLALASGFAVFSIGIPLVIAGLLCLVAAIRRKPLAPGA
jgi:hypothetical protein